MINKVKVIKPCISGNHLYEVIDAGESGLEGSQEIYAFDMPYGFEVEEIAPNWAKLTNEQLEILGMVVDGVTLIDYSTTPISFYFNAEEFFCKEELCEMPWFGTHLFEKEFNSEA